MGLTDAPKQLNLTDVYPEGTPFSMTSAWVEGVVKTQFGDRTMAKAIIEPAGGGQAQEFALWGSLCEQVQQIEEGDLPGTYCVRKDGKRWLFAPAEAPAAAEVTETAGEPEPTQTAGEEQLGVEPQPGEGEAAKA